MGVPTLGCTCPVCLSADPHNKRYRSSAAVRFHDGLEDRLVLIDTGTDFRTQALAQDVTRVDAVLYTHGHADHILGFDDLRPLTFGKPEPTPLYADNNTADTIERIFSYTFRNDDRYPTSARVRMNRVPGEPGLPVRLFGATFQRIPVQHGRHIITGWRFGRAAYITDMSDLPEEAFPLLQDLDVLVPSALRHEPHPSHAHLEKAIAVATRIGARSTYFTHISHGLDHQATEDRLPAGMHMAYDGLRLTFDLQAEEHHA
jgi:phosphoribosyl 1,2-cyclic phosphate phosphodiesterase